MMICTHCQVNVQEKNTLDSFGAIPLVPVKTPLSSIRVVERQAKGDSCSFAFIGTVFVLFVIVLFAFSQLRNKYKKSVNK